MCPSLLAGALVTCCAHYRDWVVLYLPRHGDWMRTVWAWSGSRQIRTPSRLTAKTRYDSGRQSHKHSSELGSESLAHQWHDGDFDGYSFKGRHSVIINDEEEVSDEEQEEEEDVIRPSALLAALNRDAAVATVLLGQEGPIFEPKTPDSSHGSPSTPLESCALTPLFKLR